MTEQPQIGRLAFREEGDLWVCYYAMPDTMEGALRLASIAMRAVERKDRKDQFIALMREVLSDIFEDTHGVRPTWPNPPQPAPEHERGQGGPGRL